MYGIVHGILYIAVYYDDVLYSSIGAYLYVIRMMWPSQVEDVKKFLEDPDAYAAANPVAAAPAAGGGGGEAKKEEKKVGRHTSDLNTYR